MVVLDQFYQISEKETHRVPVFWKAAHIAVFFVAAACGFVTAFTFGHVLHDFNYNCVLDANLAFDNDTFLRVRTHNGTKAVRALDLTMTFWGPLSECNFAQFTPLFIMISALIWGIYFTILARGGGGYSSDLLSRPFSIVYPCIFFCVVALLTYFISTLKLQAGLRAFCEQFSVELGNEKCVEEINVYTQQFFDKEEKDKPYMNFYLNQEVAYYSSHIGVWMWLIQLCLLIVRVCCVTDFDLHLVSVMRKDEEIIENVIEPDDDEDTEDETLKI